MRKTLCAAVTFICLIICSCSPQTEKEYKENIFAMDTVMDLTVYSENETAALEAEKEIKRIDSLLDRGNESSEIYRINNDKSAEISQETAGLIRSALNVCERTNGAFDISIAPVMDLWGFYGGNFRVPSDDELSLALKDVGYKRISLDSEKISIPQKMSIDLGGIGKGYASDAIIATLKENGVSSAIISLGGNVHTLGAKKDGSKWTVGITDPRNTSNLIGTLKVTDKAVVTSGGYQRYFESNGIVYHHIINPKTGRSANSGLTSVTIVSESGTLADGLSTALFVMGLEKGTELWKQSSDFDAVFVTEDGAIYVTEGIADTFESDFEYQVYKR